MCCAFDWSQVRFVVNGTTQSRGGAVFVRHRVRSSVYTKEVTWIMVMRDNIVMATCANIWTAHVPPIIEADHEGGTLATTYYHLSVFQQTWETDGHLKVHLLSVRQVRAALLDWPLCFIWDVSTQWGHLGSQRVEGQQINHMATSSHRGSADGKEGLALQLGTLGLDSWLPLWQLHLILTPGQIRIDSPANKCILCYWWCPLAFHCEDTASIPDLDVSACVCTVAYVLFCSSLRKFEENKLG